MEMNPKETAVLDQLIKATEDYAVATGTVSDWEHGVDAHGFASMLSHVHHGWIEFHFTDMGEDEITIQAGFCHDGDCAGCIDLGSYAYNENRISECPECGKISGARLLSGVSEIGQFLAIAYVFLGVTTMGSAYSRIFNAPLINGYSRIINRPLVFDDLAGGFYSLTATQGPYTIRLFPNCDCCECHVRIQETKQIKDAEQLGEIDTESGVVWDGELIEIIQTPSSFASYIVVAS